MSKIIATITQIKNVQSLNIVDFDFKGTPLTMMSLDLASNIVVGGRVELSVKPTHLAIVKDFAGEFSYSNQIKATIVTIEKGELISSITLKVHDVLLQSIITTKSTQRMNLQTEDDVTIFFKASELSILEVLND
ncbi:MAG: TOBE domain-containing protein [Candidatus Marinarcus sp.]|uniref:TOBE domain-containing protein n=1 Tax=Candidatus Marinarcus sp. TaxID=3100987 RepID=UPI003B00AD72